MPEPSFTQLKRDLIRAGVASRYVRRTLSELRDHYRDIEADALAAGRSARAAQREASERLGRHDVIVAHILEHKQLRSPVAWLGPALAGMSHAFGGDSVSDAARHSMVRWSVSAGVSASVTCTLLLAMQLFIEAA